MTEPRVSPLTMTASGRAGRSALLSRQAGTARQISRVGIAHLDREHPRECLVGNAHPTPARERIPEGVGARKDSRTSDFRSSGCLSSISAAIAESRPPCFTCVQYISEYARMLTLIISALVSSLPPQQQQPVAWAVSFNPSCEYSTPSREPMLMPSSGRGCPCLA